MENLEPELRTDDFMQELSDMKLSFKLVTNEQGWHDFSDADIIIAIRSFKKRDYSHKPSAKIMNAWLANVLIIVRKESVYLAEKQSEFDFIEVSSKEELLLAIAKRRDTSKQYEQMVRNGTNRARSLSPENICRGWIDLIGHLIEHLKHQTRA